jgi:chorismate mutase
MEGVMGIVIDDSECAARREDAGQGGRVGQEVPSEAGRAARLETLVQHRGCIDRIDKTIVALLAERIRLGLVLGELKRELRLPTRSESREAEVLTHVRQAAAGPLSWQAVERIFSTIIAETTAVQDRRHD